MTKEYKCPGKEFYNEVIEGCIYARANPEYFSDSRKENSRKHGIFLEKAATQIEIAMEYAFLSTTKEEQEQVGFKKAMQAMNSYRQGVYYKGNFIASLSGCKNK